MLSRPISRSCQSHPRWHWLVSHCSARSPLAVDAKVSRSRKSQAETQVRTVLIRGPFFYGVMLARGFSLARSIARSSVQVRRCHTSSPERRPMSNRLEYATLRCMFRWDVGEICRCMSGPKVNGGGCDKQDGDYLLRWKKARLGKSTRQSLMVDGSGTALAAGASYPPQANA